MFEGSARREVESEIDSNRNGQRWSVRMRQDGVLVHNGSAVTRAPSGSFSVERRSANGVNVGANYTFSKCEGHPSGGGGAGRRDRRDGSGTAPDRHPPA